MLGASAQTRLFKSGFDTNVYLDPAYNSSYQYIRGSDSVTGYTWPITAFSPHSQLTGIQNVISSNQSTYLDHAIETMPGPTGASTKALRLKLKAPATSMTCCIQAALQTVGMTTDIKDVYVRYWTKMNPEFASQAASQTTGFWRMTWEFKTSSDYRITPMIFADSSGRPYWYIKADNNAAGCGGNCQTFWSTTNKNVPVPTDRWFLMEFYLHRSTGSDGRVYMAVDGQTIVDRMGPNYGVNNEKINVIMYKNLYGTAFPMYEWMDDIEIWDRPPCGNLPCGAPSGGGSGTPADTQAPTAPASLTASAVSASQINLSWSASSDNVGVAGYRIYRDGGATPIANATGTSYQDNGLAPLSAHTYTVAAFDAAGNTSAKSITASATTQVAPVSLVRSMIPTASTTLYNPSYITDDNPAATLAAGAGSGSQWIQFDLGKTYAVKGAKIIHFDDGRTYRDVIVKLSNSATFASGVTTVFNNDRDNSSGQGVGTDAEYAETATGKNITFAPVSARYVRMWVNGSTMNQWNHYAEVEVYGDAVSDTSAPSVPAGLTATAASSSQINLAWTASADNVGVTGYRIYRNGGTTPLATVAGTTYQDTGLTAATAYSYTVSAIDAAGNASSNSNTAYATTPGTAGPDATAPSVPANLKTTALSMSRISLTWNASTDNVAVAGYRVYRNGGTTPVASVSTPSFVDTDLAESTVYTYTVAAYDAAGNTSAKSSPASTTTPAAPPSLIKGKTPWSSANPIYDPLYSTDGITTNQAQVTGAGSGPQWIQFDLAQVRSINAVKLWHFIGDDRVYRDVIIQVSNDGYFKSGVTTLFNNDKDNSSGQGVGKDLEYSERPGGKVIDFNPINARYVRIWSNGSSINQWNHYTEVAVYAAQ